jgi:hypothetical protein
MSRKSRSSLLRHRSLSFISARESPFLKEFLSSGSEHSRIFRSGQWKRNLKYPGLFGGAPTGRLREQEDVLFGKPHFRVIIILRFPSGRAGKSEKCPPGWEETDETKKQIQGLKMQNYRDLLFSKAFNVVPGEIYNRVSSELRGKFRHSFYEIILPEGAPWKYVEEKVMPSFLRYCAYKSIRPETATRLIVSLFYRGRFYLIAAKDFIKEIQQIERTEGQSPHQRLLLAQTETEH